MFKLKIMVPVSLTGFTGYFLYKPVLSPEILLVTMGILCLGISASILNQIQEVDTDRQMERTRNRPLPSGRLSLSAAFIAFFILIITGSLLILEGGNTTALLLGLFTILWYNGVYTILKRKTAYAVIPGALTGAMPPLIGWVAGGGDPSDTRIIVIMVSFFSGQMPHFWLLLMKYGDQYASAGMPSLTSNMGEAVLKKLILVFIIITSLTALFLQPLGIITHPFIYSSIIIISVVLIIIFQRFLLDKNAKQKVSRYSIFLNTYYLLIMILLVSDRLITLFRPDYSN